MDELIGIARLCMAVAVVHKTEVADAELFSCFIDTPNFVSENSVDGNFFDVQRNLSGKIIYTQQ